MPAPAQSAVLRVDTSAARPATNLLTSGSVLIAAKIVFVLAGYAMYASLSRLLSPAEFGTFLVVNSTVAVLNAVFVSGTIQAVSRFVAQRPESAGGTLRAALGLQLVLAGSVGTLYFLAAPFIASALHDDSLVPYLRLSAVIPVAYAFYAALIGYVNGRRQFAVQAAFDVSFSMVKIAAVVGLAWLGYGALGAIAGFSGASVLILVAAWVTIGRIAVQNRTGGTPALTILRFELAVMGHVAVTNLLMQMDLLLVKGLYASGDASTAAAMYGSASKLAQIPYSLLVALNFLIFPYIAQASASASRTETAQYIRQALRVGAALTVGPAVVLAAVSPAAVSLVFGPGYAAAAPVLKLLACGYIAFSLLTMAATIINGAGRPGVSFSIALGTLIAQVILARLLIPTSGITGGAAASASAYTLGLLAATAYLIAKFGSVLPWTSLARIAVAVVAIVLVPDRFIDNLPVILIGPCLGAVYVATLILLREWNAADLNAVLGRTPKPR